MSVVGRLSLVLVHELARLHRKSPGIICLILARYGYVFEFTAGGVRPVRGSL
jgi:hypothetical protein